MYSCIIFYSCVQLKWSTLLHHVIGEHQWLTGQCEHDILQGPPTDPDGNQLACFDKNEPAFKALRKLVMDEKWLKSMVFYTKFR